MREDASLSDVLRKQEMMTQSWHANFRI